MRIEQLDLERYGAFTDRSLAFDPQAALHIVYGRNEAGKTSALSAIGDLLFGFGARTDYDFVHDQRLLRIGGRFRHSDGRLIVARRRKGNRNTLLDHDDQPLSDNAFAPLIGTTTRDAFLREFGLTASALREGGQELLRAGGRLAETLAAGSAGMTALSHLRTRLQTEADDLFTPRRSAGKPFYVALQRREAADRALRDAIVTHEAIRAAEEAVKAARAKLDGLNAAHTELGAQIALWRRTLRVSSPLARLDAIRDALASFASFPDVPTQTLDRWREAHAAWTRVGDEIAALDAADAATAGELAALAIDDGLLAAGPQIDALRERLGAIGKAREDLPRRRQAREDARAALDDRARRLDLGSHVALLAKMPTDLATAEVRELIGEAASAEAALADATQRYARAQRELAELSTKDADCHVGDMSQLRQRFEAMGDVATQSEQYRRAVATLTLDTDTLRADIAALSPFPGELETLQSVPFPDAGAIAGHQHTLDAAETEAKRLDEAMAAANATAAAIKEELAVLSRTGGTATRTDLMHARQDRDTQTEGLRQILDGDADQRRRQLEQVRRAARRIDDITDLLLGDTERATRQEDAQRRLAEQDAARGELAGKRNGAAASLACALNDWNAVWSPLGLSPRRPAEMLRWRERLDAVIVRLRKRDAQRLETNALASALVAAKQAVVSFLESVGRMPDRSLSVEVLYREAKGRFDELTAAWAARSAREAERKRTERDAVEAGAARDAAKSALAAIAARWPAAMAGLALPADATSAQAETALEHWRAIPALEVSYRREGRSVATIESDLQAFENDVAALTLKVAASLADVAAEVAARRMSDALTRARADSERANVLREQSVRRAANRQGLVAKRAGAEAVLDEPARLLAAPDMPALAEALEKIAAFYNLAADQRARRRELHEIAEGRDEAELRREREGLDLDTLPSEIARAELRQKQHLDDIGTESVAVHQAEAALDSLTAGRNAAAAAAERADANAELLAVAEAWLLRATAGRLAARAIERYRARVQDPLVDRAGTLFAVATDGAFAGLRVGYGDDDQPILVVERTNGERVPIEGLSEGTRDQLFLSLRLALLERLPTETIPFIGDDLLTSFDDNRTLAALRLLAAAGAQRQMIVFTHHRHVAESARRLAGHTIDMIEL